jgi:peroxiredoxin/Ca2+-binding EF-hand superfamily protein
MIRRLLPVSLMFFLGYSIAFSAPAPIAGVLAERFRQLDKNGDGKLTPDELPAEWMQRLDLNHDGVVTLDEAREAFEKTPALVLFAGGKIETAFKLLDKDGDGFLTRAETNNAEWFDRADENKDGKVTLEEARRTLGALIARRLGSASAPEAPEPKPDESLKEQPRILNASEHGVGRMVPDVALKDLAGREVKLSAFKGNKALVIASFGASCPISNKLGPELARLEKEYAAQKVAFLFVNPIAGESPEDLRKFAAMYGLTSPVVHDAQGALARVLGATTTTEVFVLDAARTLVYRGAINDQYGLGYSKDAPTKTYLRDALAAVLGGTAPMVAATTAPGCALDLPAPVAATSDAPTYHRDVSRVVQAHCLECHRTGGIAPFALESYGDLIEHSAMIKKQLTREAMPPWFASKEQSGVHAIFANDRSLPEPDKAALLAWLKSDRPKGDPADAPLPRVFPEGWTIGKPDAVFQLPQPVQIKAEGTMPYQRQIVETSFPEDRWVQGYEILPTAREVVHHVIVKVHDKGSKLTDRDEGTDGFFAAYVPGNSHRMLPDGFAKRLPAGAKISFQIHYTPNGKATQDQLKIGFIFAKTPPQNEVHVVGVAQPRLNIPPGEANHVETKLQVVPMNMNVTAYMAHMHVRGKAFKYELITADGKTETLLDIPRYDFNWQLQYDYAQPKFIPRGSTMKITAVFDNSAGNPANPDPNKTVKWGPQTTDEMMIGYIEHYTPLGGAGVAAK